MAFALFPGRMDTFAVGERVASSQKYRCSSCGHLHLFVRNESFRTCDQCAEENVWVPTGRLLSFVSKNLNKEFERIQTLHLKFADTITDFVGNLTFLYVHAGWFGLWIAINEGWVWPGHAFDPYPYGLLTMIVSLEAIFLTTLVMVSQNVQSRRSELRAELDYQVNLKAEKEIAVIHDELKHNNEMTQRLLEMIESRRR